MKFSKKLQKLRKENNLSQESLAEKLGMSRQAVSKWESGNSYPDMNTMISICKVLNCTLEDLMDDDTIRHETSDKNVKYYLKKCLDTITDSYNMLCDMGHFDRIKCIFEIGFIVLIIYLFSLLLNVILINTILKLFMVLPDVIYDFISKIYNMMYSIFAIVMGVIITLHLFKTRYLDYYIKAKNEKVLDKNEKVENDENVNLDKKNERIIIRDPKRENSRFVDVIIKFAIILLKVFIISIAIPFISSFVFISFVSTISIIWLKYGIIFLGALFCSLGALLINYDILELAYKFIFNRKYCFRRLFILFVVGLSMIGIGLGIGINEVSKFTFEDTKNNNIVLRLDMDEDISISNFENYISDNKIIINNNIDYIEFNIDYFDYYKPILEKDYNGVYYIDVNNVSFKDVRNIVINEIKNKKIMNYNGSTYEVNSITLSQDNYNRIMENTIHNN